MSEKPDSARWKQKYYDSLEQIEKKEKRWRGVENLLRRGIARLTLAARGVNDPLDRELERLRNAIRDGRDSAALQQLIEAVGGNIARLDQDRARAAPPAAGGMLAQMLDKIALPRRFARKARVLGKRLEMAQNQAELTQLLDELCALLQEALVYAQPASDTPDPPPRAVAAEPGVPQLMKKLFRHEQAQERQGMDAVDASSAVHTMLVQLVERLELPQEMEQQVDALKKRLAQGAGGARCVESLEQVAALVNEARESLLREKRAIIEFLERVNSRIEELDRHVQGASQEQQRSFDSGHEFAAAVQMQVRGIEQSVQSAVDLDQLKQSVQSGLDALHVRIVAQRASETERHAAAQRQLHALTEKLRCMEGESEQLRERLHQERQLALRDGLTDLPNRLAYKERVEYEHARWRRYAAPLALLVWDVDRFKAINDTYGHKAGDKALKTIAQLLQSQLRKTDFLARYGGEEFIMLMPETPLRDARAVAEKLLAAVANSRFHYREQAVPISISCGLTEFCGQDTPETAFERADQAMYRAKQAGGNRCHSAKCAG